MDYESFSRYDCTQYYTAKREKADCIITRNTKDFSLSDIPVFTPDEFLNSFLKKQ